MGYIFYYKKDQNYIFDGEHMYFAEKQEKVYQLFLILYKFKPEKITLYFNLNNELILKISFV